MCLRRFPVGVSRDIRRLPVHEGTKGIPVGALSEMA